MDSIQKALEALFVICFLFIFHRAVNRIVKRVIGLPNAIYRSIFERKAMTENPDWEDDSPIHPR